MSRVADDARVTDLLEVRAQRGGRSPLEFVIDRIWRFLCSVRAAMYEIGFLALLVLIGTLKGSVIPAQIPKYIPALEPVVVRWYRFDVFHSLIFSLTLALIALAIVVCTVNRIPGIWASIAAPTVTTPASFFSRAEMAARISVAADAGAVSSEVTQALRKRRFRVLTAEKNGELHIYADKNRFGRLGTFPFHLALIMILVGGIVGSEYGYRVNFFDIPEGAIRDVGHGSGLRVKLERFVDTYNEIGAPTKYESDLVLYDGEKEVKRQSITVNHPMKYRNMTFYQASFGQAADMRVTDPNGLVLFADGVSFSYTSRANVAAPAAVIELPAQGVRFELIYPNIKLDAKPEIGDTKLIPGQMYIQPVSTHTGKVLANGVVVNQGERASLAGYTVQFIRENQFTVLQIASNPGIPILFAGSLLIVVGLIVTFGLPHRRIRLLLRPTSDGTELLLAPMARRDWGGKKEFIRALGALEHRFGPATPYGRLADELD